jgi:hypothetical protein
MTTQTLTEANNNEVDVWDDPPDEWYHMESWGIDDWCRSHNLEPVPERNVLGAWLPCQSRWLAHDTYFDGAARTLAKTARLPVSWRVDWSPLMKWLEAGCEFSVNPGLMPYRSHLAPSITRHETDLRSGRRYQVRHRRSMDPEIPR